MDARKSDSESKKDYSKTKSSRRRRVSTQGTTEGRRRSERIRRASRGIECEDPKSDKTCHSSVRKKLFVKKSSTSNSKTTERNRRLREPMESDYDSIRKRSMSSAGGRLGFTGKRAILEILDEYKKSELEENSKESPPPSARFRRINTQSRRRKRQQTSSKRYNLVSSAAQKLRRSPRLKRKRRKL